METKIISWDDFYNPQLAHDFIKSIRRTKLIEVTQNYEDRLSIIQYENYASNSENDSFELVPNEVSYKNKNLKYEIWKEIQIKNFPEVFKFLQENCPYMQAWLSDDRKVNIVYETTLIGYEDLGNHTDQIAFIQNMKAIFKDETRYKELSILALAATITNFYKQDLKEFKISSKNTFMYKLKTHVNTFMDVLNNPKKYLESYSNIETIDSSRKVIDFSRMYFNTRFKCFSFLDNKIIEFVSFNLYRNNLDLRFLAFTVLA